MITVIWGYGIPSSSFPLVLDLHRPNQYERRESIDSVTLSFAHCFHSAYHDRTDGVSCFALLFTDRYMWLIFHALLYVVKMIQ